MSGTATTARTITSGAHTPSQVKDYLELLKPSVMSLVVFSGLVGMLVAPGTINPFIAGVAIFCIALGSGASGAINMWLERDLDAKMKRTAKRPLPQGRIAPQSAIEFGVCMAAASVFIMGLAVNLLSAVLLLSAILFYVFIYTIWLKPRTAQNIVIGGAAGAFPPLIGWVAVTNSLAIEPLILFAIIFMWTPPHFWALALHRSDDYAKAGVPMMPVTHGKKETKRQMVLYTAGLILTSILPAFTPIAGVVYGTSAVTLGAVFMWHALRVQRSDDTKVAMKMFGYSILYLFVLFSILVIDHLIFIKP
jgi:protoheme IX farnesyltransferase